MPKRITHVKWQCNLCHTEHNDRISAKQCEDMGLAVPPFKSKDIVIVSIFQSPVKGDRKILGQVTNYGPDEGFQNPHKLPSQYDVNVMELDYLPRDLKPRPLTRFGITVSSGVISLYKNEDDRICPMCKSVDIIVETEKLYAPYQYNILSSMFVEMSVCCNCRLNFFTKKQSKVVDKKIKVKLKKKKLANLRTLAAQI